MNETIRKVPQMRTRMEHKRTSRNTEKRVYMPVVQIRKAVRMLTGCGIAASAVMLIGIAGGQDLCAMPIGQAIADSAVWLGILGLCAWIWSKITR